MKKDEIYISVVAPAYNEGDTISEVVQQWIQILEKEKKQWEIIVTNDGSTDDTGVILEKMAEKHKRLKVINLKHNRGAGYALHRAVAESRGDYIIAIDSDGQYDLSEYEKLLNKIEEGFDIVTGFRHKKIDNPAKVILDRVFNIIVRLFFNMSLKDTNCPLKVYKKEVLKKLPIDSRGYSAPTEILIKAKFRGYKIGEVMITHSGRQQGESKLRVFRISLQIILFLMYLKLKLYLYRKGVLNSI